MFIHLKTFIEHLPYTSLQCWLWGYSSKRTLEFPALVAFSAFVKLMYILVEEMGYGDLDSLG